MTTASNGHQQLENTQQSMFSRAGKSTNNLYLVFQDKDKHGTVQSKVAAFIGGSSAFDESQKIAKSPLDAIKSMLSPTSNNDHKAQTRMIFEQGRKGLVKGAIGGHGSPKKDDKFQQANMLKLKQTEAQDTLAQEMRMISEEIKESELTEFQKMKKKLKNSKASEKEVIQKLLELKKRDFTSNFKSYSRDRRMEIFSNKTNPPPVGQYSPKIEVVLEQSRIPHIYRPHENAEQALKRKIDIAQQSTHICDHMIKKILFQNTERNSVFNKTAPNKITEGNENSFQGSGSPQNTTLQEKSQIKQKKADSQTNSPIKKRKNSVQVNQGDDEKNQDNQTEENQLNINSYSQKNKKSKFQQVGKQIGGSLDFGYKTLHITDNYHVVQGKEGLEKSTYQIERNDQFIFGNMFIKDRHPPLLDKYCSRVPIASDKYPPNENRFEIINKSPDCLSFNKHVMNLKINKFSSRDINKTLLPVRLNQNDYDNYVNQKDKVMKNLRNISIDMTKKAGRTFYGGFYNRPQENPETIDQSKAFTTMRDFANGKKRNQHFAKMHSYMPRDDFMYKQTDLLKNISLDNTKDERLEEQNRKNQERQMRIAEHTDKKLMKERKRQQYNQKIYQEQVQHEFN